MKRRFALVFALLVLLLAGCGAPIEEIPEQGGTSSPQEITTTEDPVVRVTFPEGLTSVEIAE